MCSFHAKSINYSLNSVSFRYIRDASEPNEISKNNNHISSCLLEGAHTHLDVSITTNNLKLFRDWFEAVDGIGHSVEVSQFSWMNEKEIHIAEFDGNEFGIHYEVCILVVMFLFFFSFFIRQFVNSPWECQSISVTFQGVFYLSLRRFRHFINRLPIASSHAPRARTRFNLTTCKLKILYI